MSGRQFFRTHAESLWTVEDVQRFLALPSRYSVYRQIREHRLPAQRLGREFRFVPSAVQAWWQRQQPDADQPTALRAVK